MHYINNELGKMIGPDRYVHKCNHDTWLQVVHFIKFIFIFLLKLLRWHSYTLLWQLRKRTFQESERWGAGSAQTISGLPPGGAEGYDMEQGRRKCGYTRKLTLSKEFHFASKFKDILQLDTNIVQEKPCIYNALFFCVLSATLSWLQGLL